MNVETQLGEVTWGDSPRISVDHKFKCASKRRDPGWVDSHLALSDITAICGSTTNFTFVTPLSSSSCQEKMVPGNYLCTRTYNIGTSFKQIFFMKFACLIRVHPWVNPIVFGRNQPNRITNMGENVTTKPFFWPLFSQYRIFMENFYEQYLVLHSP